MIRKLLFFLTLSGILLLSSSCSKHDEDILFGVWEQVNVSDINAGYSIEWEFVNGQLHTYRRSKENLEQVQLTDSGFYFLESSPFKTTLRLLDTANSTWNNDWDVIKLNGEKLIIHMDIPGGVLFKEFIKIQ